LDQSLEDRIGGVAARLQSRKDAASTSMTPEQDRRRARVHVLQALPGLVTRLTDCISELNDRLGDAGVWITLNVADRTPSIEAAFRVAAEDDQETGPDLLFNVDYTGKLTCMLRKDGDKALLRLLTIFDADRTMLLECLLDWLDAKYPPANPS
jgi:hypothetical protein